MATQCMVIHIVKELKICCDVIFEALEYRLTRVDSRYCRPCIFISVSACGKSLYHLALLVSLKASN